MMSGNLYYIDGYLRKEYQNEGMTAICYICEELRGFVDKKYELKGRRS